MPEVVHTGGASQIGLNQVQTQLVSSSGVSLSSSINNLNPSVFHGNSRAKVPRYQVNFSDTDVVVQNGDLYANNATFSGFTTLNDLTAQQINFTDSLCSISEANPDYFNNFNNFKSIKYIRRDTKNNFYIIYEYNQTTYLGKFDLNFNLISSLRINYAQYSYLSKDETSIYFTQEDSNVYIVNTNTFQLTTVSVSPYNYSFVLCCVNSVGNVYAYDVSTTFPVIYKFTDNTCTQIASTIPINNGVSQGLAVDSEDNLYIVAYDGIEYFVEKIDDTGTVLVTYYSTYTGGGNITSVDVDSNLNVYVTDPYHNIIYKYSNDGNIIYIYYTPGALDQLLFSLNNLDEFCMIYILPDSIAQLIRYQTKIVDSSGNARLSLANVMTLNVGSLFGSGNNLTNVQVSTLANLVVSNSVTTSNIFVTGQVGIGTTSPGAMLDVVTSSFPSSGTTLAQFGSTASPRIQFFDENGDSNSPPYIYGNSGYGLGLSSNGPIQLVSSQVNISANLHISNDISTPSFYTKLSQTLLVESGEGVAVSSDGNWVAFGNKIRNNVWVYNNNVQFGSNIHNPTNYFGAFLSLNRDGSVLAIGGEYGVIAIYARGSSDWYSYSYLTTGTGFVFVPSLSGDGSRCVAGPYYTGNSPMTGTGTPAVYGWNIYQGNSPAWSIPYTADFSEDMSDSYFTVISGDGSTVVVGRSATHQIHIYMYSNTSPAQSISVPYINESPKNIYVSTSYDGSRIVAVNNAKVYIYNNT